MENMSFSKAIMQYFGKKPGQTLGELMAEIKQLTEQDRKDLIPQLEQALGATITG